MKISAFGVLLISLCFLCCSEHDPNKSYGIRTTIYAVTGDNTNYKKDTIRFMEEEVFNAEDVMLERIFFNSDGSPKAKEIFQFDKELLTGSKYFDQDKQLLSYYNFELGNNKMKKSSSAYDAANDELLRVEKYSYTPTGQQSKKEILDAEGNLQRTFIFSHDEDGNETSITVTSGQGKLIYREDYLITDKDAKKSWKEVWGFVGTAANICKVKTRIDY